MRKAPIISIIDDDLPVREAIEALVRSLGYSAFSFASAEDYLRSCRVQDSSCLISDLHMPGMSGADLQDRLVADGYHTPIIVITAHFEEKVRARILAAGALCVLRKPFDNECLIQCLESALKISES